MSIIKNMAIASIILLLSACVSMPRQKRLANNMYLNSVKVTNTAENHGGTGIVLISRLAASYVLTNAHVCEVVKSGGIVSGIRGVFLVTSYKISKHYDLCLIRVAGDLGYNTVIAGRPPVPYYERAYISGHPLLMSNIVTSGHFSGRSVIQVMMGVKACTTDDLNDSLKSVYCLLLGGIPIIKNFDAVLVSATIQPGNSGSGVYNSRGELSGVAFAGNGTIGYAWTVPYEAVIDFVYHEQQLLKFSNPSNIVPLSEDADQSDVEKTFYKKLKHICKSDLKNQYKEKLKDLCSIMNSDITM